jgi:asparagine synthase (glutamine-hydrolysing)
MIHGLKINVLPKQLLNSIELECCLALRTMVALLDKKGGNVAPKIIEVLGQVNAGQVSLFGVVTTKAFALQETIGKLENKNLISQVGVGFSWSRTHVESKPELVQRENEAIVFEGRIYSPTSKTPIEEFLAKKPQSNFETGVEAFLKSTEGDFFLIIAEAAKLVAARDSVGIQPLYFGENDMVAALASNRKALWKLGISEPYSFPPGHVAVVNQEGFKFKSVKTFAYAQPKMTTMAEAAEKVQKLLEHSVQKRTQGLKEVAVAFSGGLDSSVVAFLAKKCGVSVQLLHVSLENQPETKDAWKAAEELQLPLTVHLYKEADIEKVIPRVVELIEEPDPIKASIGVPFYWTAEKTAEAKFKVLLAGQGADELFGGYQRYVNQYMLEGDEKVRQTMYDDVARIHESNIERDEKICSFHDVELRLPFASYRLVKYALSIPTELKIEKKADSLRKLVLRKAAENMGLSEFIVKNPKKAVQYSTGINNALKKLAKKHQATLTEYINEVFQKQKNV